MLVELKNVHTDFILLVHGKDALVHDAHWNLGNNHVRMYITYTMSCCGACKTT